MKRGHACTHTKNTHSMAQQVMHDVKSRLIATGVDNRPKHYRTRESVQLSVLLNRRRKKGRHLEMCAFVQAFDKFA